MTERTWTNSLTQEAGRRRSELCKAQDFHKDWYHRWCFEMKEKPRYHRKQWEYAYNMQALWERDCIHGGSHGLVFAVGTEPAPSIFANYGCHILATDIYPAQGKEKGWKKTGQLCVGLDSLNKRQLCEEGRFRELVGYQPLDMNAIPENLQGFDFNWSSCSFEHLGSIEKGLAFLKNQLNTLRPGGWAVHTTEFNISSNDETQDLNDTVIFRQRDIDRVIGELREEGHFVEETDYSIGGMPEDFMVDITPHRQEVHVKLQVGRFVVTSLGLIIRKKG